jgi:hypothetical protein
MHEHACIFVIKYPRIWILVLFYNAIMHKNEFGQIYSRYLLKRIYTKFTLHFKTFMQFLCILEVLLFSRNYLINPKREKDLLGHGPNLAHMPQLLRTGGPTWLRGIKVRGGPVGLARGGHHTRESRGDTAINVQPGEEARTGQWLENLCGTGEVSGKVFGGGAQRIGVATLRRRSLGPTMLRQRWWPPAVVNSPEGILQQRASEEIKECLIWTKADSWRLSLKEREGSGCGFACGERRSVPVVGVDKKVIASPEGGREILARWVFSRRGEGGGWRSSGSVTSEQSKEETMGADTWRVPK